VAYPRDEGTKQQLAALRERMNRLFDESLASGEPAWTPPADVYRARGQVVITVELPGVADESVTVETEGRILRVRGQRTAAPGERGALQLERSYGPFLREFPLPEGARIAELHQSCHDGVLRIEIPVD
jgi:HSP20 family protein